MNLDGNLIGLVLVYIYVMVVFLISEKLLKNSPSFSRKFTHIMVGNIIFLLPIFSGRVVMTFLIALPILIFSFLLTKHSPININNSITSSGHTLGLFYYSLSWTILAFFFYDQPYIITVGIAAMSYGDGFASLIGQRFGKHKYNLVGDIKSIEGSLAMFLVLIATLCLSLGYYVFIIGYPLYILNLFAIVTVSALATFVEAISPKGIDNLTVCFASVVLYILILI